MANPRQLYQYLERVRTEGSEPDSSALGEITADDIREVLVLAGDLAPLEVIDTATALAARLDERSAIAGDEAPDILDLAPGDDDAADLDLGREPGDLDELADLDLDFGGGAGDSADETVDEAPTNPGWAEADDAPVDHTTVTDAVEEGDWHLDHDDIVDDGLDHHSDDDLDGL